MQMRNEESIRKEVCKEGRM